MKKLMTLLLAAVMLLGTVAMAEEVSLTLEELKALASACAGLIGTTEGQEEVNGMLADLSQEDLRALYNLCAVEIGRRSTTPLDVWYQSEDGSVTIRIIGLEMTRLNGVELQIDYEILNSSEYEVSFKCDDVAVNGWMSSGDYSWTANPRRNARNTLQFTSLNRTVGWESPQQAAEEINIMEFDLVVTIGSEKITIPVVITDFSQMTVTKK